MGSFWLEAVAAPGRQTRSRPLAKALATIDRFSEGRLVVGGRRKVGASWLVRTASALAARHGPPQARRRVTGVGLITSATDTKGVRDLRSEC
jgi:hypothetical protein